MDSPYGKFRFAERGSGGWAAVYQVHGTIAAPRPTDLLAALGVEDWATDADDNGSGSDDQEAGDASDEADGELPEPGIHIQRIHVRDCTCVASSPVTSIQHTMHTHMHMHTHAELFTSQELRKMGTKAEIAGRAQAVMDAIGDRAEPISVANVKKMIHTITNNITTDPAQKKQRTS